MTKKAFVVYPRTKAQAKEGLVIKGKRKKFTGGTMMNLWGDDAAEVKDMYGRDRVHVIEDEQLGRALNGEKWTVTDSNEVKTLHKYTFGPSKKYADAWEAFEKRRKDKLPKKLDNEADEAEAPDEEEKKEAR